MGARAQRVKTASPWVAVLTALAGALLSFLEARSAATRASVVHTELDRKEAAAPIERDARRELRMRVRANENDIDRLIRRVNRMSRALADRAGDDEKRQSEPLTQTQATAPVKSGVYDALGL